MAQSAEDAELLQSVEAFFRDDESSVLVAFKVTKCEAAWSVAGRRNRLTSKPRILSITATRSKTTQKFKVKIQILKQVTSGLEISKVYKLKHLGKVESVPSDTSGCTFVLGFENLKSHATIPPQWTMRNVDDRNRFLTIILKLCKENLGRLPKIVGMDVVDLALWAQANAKALPIEGPNLAESADSGASLKDQTVTVEKDLVSKAEEEDMEALLGTYVMGIDEAEAFSERLKRELSALEAANVYAILESEPLVEEVLLQLDSATSSVEDMDEWLGIFNVKLRHMREDIESIEARNNRLEVQAQNNALLVEELNKLLDRLRIPPEYAALLRDGSFEEARMPQNVEACDWLSTALRNLEPPFLDPNYAGMRAVRDKRLELEKLKAVFVRRATEFLADYFSSVVQFMAQDKTHFSQKGQLKRPDHADLRFKCRTYARMLQHLKGLEKNSLAHLRDAYCDALNFLLRREAREFAHELRASTKLPRSAVNTGAIGGPGNPDGPGSTSFGATTGVDTSNLSEAYGKMLRIFIPLLVDESSFFASFMCFEVLPLAPPGGPPPDKRGDYDDDDGDISPLHMDGNDSKQREQNNAELEALNQALHKLLNGIQEDFYAVVDWASKMDPLRCIAMQGVTERYLSGHKADAAGFVRQLLADLQSRISSQFNKFIEESSHNIESKGSIKQAGVISYIPRFASLAAKMESLIQGNSRDMVDTAYTKLVGTMFNTLEHIASLDPKHSDVLLLENYAAFQNSMFELANKVPTLAKYYQQASESYEQACTRYITSIINYQFDKLFQFTQKVENLLYTVTPEEVAYHYQVGTSNADLRKLLKATLPGVEKSLQTMYRRMQKHLTSEELLPSLWEKCKESFLDKYEGLENMIAKCYPSVSLSPSLSEMKELCKTV